MRALGGPKTTAGVKLGATAGQSPLPTPSFHGSSSVVVSDSYREEAKAAGGVVTETLEQSWFRATSTSPAGWLAEDEDQRRYRIEAASRAAGVAIDEGQREALLQRLDEVASKASGQPMPVYRGVPVAGSPYDAPNDGPYVPAGNVESQSGPSTGTVLMVAAAAMVFVAMVGSVTMYDGARSNPSKRRKKSWFAKWFGGSPKPVKRAKKRS